METKTLKLDTAAVRTALESRASSRHALAIAQILGGLALTFLVPLIFAAGALIYSGTNGFLLVLVLFLVLMPIAFFFEWRTEGGYFMRRLREIQAGDGGWYWAISRDRTWRWHARQGAAQWELFLFAPRQVFAGFAKLRGMRMVALPDTSRAAEILAQLAASDRGIPVESLRRAGEHQLALSQALSYLLFYDWVGSGESGEKVWLLTQSREELKTVKP